MFETTIVHKHPKTWNPLQPITAQIGRSKIGRPTCSNCNLRVYRISRQIQRNGCGSKIQIRKSSMFDIQFRVSQLWSMMFTSGGNLQGFGPKYPGHIMNSVQQRASSLLYMSNMIGLEASSNLRNPSSPNQATKATCCRGGKLSQTFPASKISFCVKKWLVTSSMVFIPKTYTIYIRYKL